ncbi:hypothetical protein Cme02nite_50510 [Catellatospora methionotrophica]|uniref:Guanylate kinase-like domain-containing protein n=1 Tax=Catellatospora methionotrophica TaxID=121620 RepID=A0A8J3LJD0_9ACTN|nr:hypothetical protein [Catellatospora methionotrophica]GIG16719.1 hypothetical protein Cme02nite_50510 [Catellatospora methionotrophica]
MDTRRGERGVHADPAPPNGAACLVLIGGRSGCGKTTVVEQLVTDLPAVYARVPSFTSRARRPGEGDGEYRFVTRAAMLAMSAAGDLFSLDEAYGDYYAMSRRAIEEITDGGRFAVKEMHAKNHPAVLAQLPGTISVLLWLPDERWSDDRVGGEPARRLRLAEDQAYYAALAPDRFDIVHRIEAEETPSMIAQALHVGIQQLAGARCRPAVAKARRP